MRPFPLALDVMASFVASTVGTGVLRRLLARRKVLDHPGARSSHDVPTPRGGGLAIYAVLMSMWSGVVVVSGAPSEVWWIMACSFALAVVSWLDDVVGLPMMPRLLLQIAVASVGSYMLSGPEAVFQGYLPPIADKLGTAFLWVGFINLFNFTDGIDGNAGTKATVVGIGIFLLSVVGEVPTSLGILGLTLAAAAAGFLPWNWHPARIFMGDVGSVTLGFLLAWLLLRTAAEGAWAPAMILPLVYLADTCLTYLLKILRRERFWHPHRDHYYQRAVQRPGVTHSHVVKSILLGDVVLIVIAVFVASSLPWVALSLGGITSAVVIRHLHRVHADGG